MDVLQTTKLDAADISLLVMTAWNQMTHQLPSKEQDSFDRKLKMTATKEILKGWAEIVEHHYIKARFRAKPTDTGNSSPSTELCVDAMLVM